MSFCVKNKIFYNVIPNKQPVSEPRVFLNIDTVHTHEPVLNITRRPNIDSMIRYVLNNRELACSTLPQLRDPPIDLVKTAIDIGVHLQLVTYSLGFSAAAHEVKARGAVLIAFPIWSGFPSFCSDVASTIFTPSDRDHVLGYLCGILHAATSTTFSIYLGFCNVLVDRQSLIDACSGHNAVTWLTREKFIKASSPSSGVAVPVTYYPHTILSAPVVPSWFTNDAKYTGPTAVMMLTVIVTIFIIAVLVFVLYFFT